MLIDYDVDPFKHHFPNDASEVGWGAVHMNHRRKRHPAAYIDLQIPTTPDPLMSLNPDRTLRRTSPGCWIYLPAGYVPLNDKTLQSS